MPVFHDKSGRSASSRALKVRGSIVAAVLAILGVVLYQWGAGDYDKTFRLTLLTNVVGEGLAPGAEVKFHGLTIGSVKTLESAGFNKQRMTVALDPKQAKALTADTTARFTSSNIFGTAAVELDSAGKGPRLRANRTLEITGEAASVTGVLRQMQRLGSVLDTREFNAMFELLRKYANLTAPTVKSVVDLSKMVADSLKVPFSQSLSVIASLISGFDDFIPMISLVNGLLDKLDFITGPSGAEHAVTVINDVTKILIQSTEAVVKNMPWAFPFFNSLFDLVVPSYYFLGSLAPAYDRLSGLIDRTSAAFREEDGKVRMQINVIMDAAPGLAAALPPPAGVQAPAPPLGSAPTAPGG